MTAKEKIQALEEEIKELEYEKAKKKAEIKQLQDQQVSRGGSTVWKNGPLYNFSIFTDGGRNQKVFSVKTKDELYNKMDSLVLSLEELKDAIVSGLIE